MRPVTRIAKEKADKELAAEVAVWMKERQAEAQRRAKAQAEARAVCVALYKATADKKVSDLTVKQEQAVRACQALGLYSPK